MNEADFSALLSRVVERLQHLSQDRLVRIETSARACLQVWADLSFEGEGLAPVEVFDIGVLGLGDQFAVLGTDILASHQSSSVTIAFEQLKKFKCELDLI